MTRAAVCGAARETVGRADARDAVGGRERSIERRVRDDDDVNKRNK